MSERIRPLLIWAVVLLAIRGVGLGTYPQIHPDEGFWTQGPRNWVRYGEPLRDGRLHPFLCPGHFAVLSGFFAIGPASLWGGRLFSVLMGAATCLLMALIGYKSLPRRPWLVVFLFGLTSLTFLIQREALLEAHQMFWMALAAWCWLSGSDGGVGRPAPSAWGPAGAGAALGMALLVKSNSIYLLPAFALGVPWVDRKSALRALVVFAAVCLLVTGGGYLLDWWTDPASFAKAFRFELQDQKFDDAKHLFRIGRFGLNPDQLIEVLTSLIKGEPFLPILALLGLALLARHRSELTQADRLFAAWLILGLGFNLGQIYVEHRYLTTLAPAFAYLAARCLDRVLGEPGSSSLNRMAVAALLAVFVLFHGVKLVRGLTGDRNQAYWDTIEYVGQTAPPDAEVLAASYVVQSLPQPGYDFYRYMFPYDRRQKHVPLADAVRQSGASWIVVDSEWDIYRDADIDGFLRTNCERVKEFGEFQVYQVRKIDN